MPKPRDMVTMSETEIHSFLASSLTAVLTTLDGKGWPHSTAMWFVPDLEDAPGLRMWTYAKSQKAVNLRRDARCAVLIERGTDYVDLQGVLVRAQASITDDVEEIARIGKDLYRRYVADDGGSPEGPALEEIERQATKRIGLTVPLTRLASWDHSKLGGSPYRP